MLLLITLKGFLTVCVHCTVPNDHYCYGCYSPFLGFKQFDYLQVGVKSARRGEVGHHCDTFELLVEN